MKLLRWTFAHLLAGVVIVVLMVSCGASARQHTLATALQTTNTARDAWLAYQDAKEQQIVADAPSLDAGKAALADFRAKRAKVDAEFSTLYTLIDAAVISDKAPLDGAVKAAQAIVDELKALGVKL